MCLYINADMRITRLLLFLTLTPFVNFAQSTEPNDNHCGTSEQVKQYYNLHADAKNAHDQFEKFTDDFVRASELKASKSTAAPIYIIPVVFHVYDSLQGGKKVNYTIIKDAMDMLNQDFQGLNTDYSTVHSQFMGIRGKMPDVLFALAQKDPTGKSTNGIVYHASKKGYGNGNGYDTQIAVDAWDNYKYMNVYIMYDLYNDGVTNNSGVAWYPDTIMSNKKVARVVYNGVYLGKNCTSEPEFASTLSHEFGHWLNLIHTFEGGCVAPNDNVADTPPCDFNKDKYTCHTTATANVPLNCTSNLINVENYMDYGGARKCYKMFTQGQVLRMYAALQHPARKPLWQIANIKAAGLEHLLTTDVDEIIKNNDNDLIAYPNPATNQIDIYGENLKNECAVDIYNTVGVRVLALRKKADGYLKMDISSLLDGLYYCVINTASGVTMKITIEKSK